MTINQYKKKLSSLIQKLSQTPEDLDLEDLNNVINNTIEQLETLLEDVDDLEVF